MCIICRDFNLGKLTPMEATRNLGELSERLSPAHIEQVEELIAENSPEPFEE